MFLYHIKQNGYIIGQAKGKKKAVEFVKTLLDANDIEDAIWHKRFDGAIIVMQSDNFLEEYYRIERAY